MYVKAYMATPPVTILSDEKMVKVRETLGVNKFRHLPIVDNDGVLLGMLTDRDIRSAYPSTALPDDKHMLEVEKIDHLPVKDVMNKEVVWLNEYATLDDALLLLDAKRVGAAPVVDKEKKVIGIFSIRDMLCAYRKLFGLGEKGGALVAVKSDGKDRPLTRISHILEENNIHYSRLVRAKTDDKSDLETIYIRVNTFNIHAVHSALKEAGFAIDLLQPNP